MKKLVLAFTGLLAFATAQAQDLTFGVKAGLMASDYNKLAVSSSNNTNFYSLNDYNTSYKVGIYVGGLVDIPLVEEFRIQPELNLSIVPDSDFGYIALSIPVMVKYPFFDKFYGMAGPALNFAVDADADQFSPSFNLGATYDVMEHFYVELRGDIGIAGYLNHNLNAGVGYRF